MTGSEKLGRVIAGALGAEEGYRAAILPRRIDPAVIKAAVGRSGELAEERAGFPADYALELSDHPEDREKAGYLQVGWGQAVAYRAGAGRLFYSEEGRFTGGASLSNAIPPILGSNFPGEGGGEIGIDDISEAVEDHFRLVSPDLFSADNWKMFNEAVLEVITFTAKLFEEAGNQDLGQWQLGWWNHLKYLLDQLDTYFVENQGKLGDFRPGHVFFLAGLPKPREDNVSYQYIDSKKYWNAFTEYWSDAEKAIDSCSYLKIIHKKEPEGLDWGQYQARITSQGHSVLALTTLENKTPGSSPYEFWRGIDELDFLRRSQGENDPLHNLRVRFQRVVGEGEEQECPKWYPKTHLVPLFLQEQGGKDWGGEYKIIFEDIAYSLFDGQESLEPSLLSAVVKAPVDARVNKIEVEPEIGQPHLAISIELKISLEDEDTLWPTSPVDFSLELKGSNDGLRLLEKDRKLKVKLLFPNPSSASLFIEAKEGKRNRPRLMVFNGDSSSEPNRLEEEVIRLRAPARESGLYLFDSRVLSIDKAGGGASFKYQAQEGIPHGLSGLSYLTGQALTDDEVIEGDEASVAEGFLAETLAKVVVDNQPKNPPWLPLIATSQGVRPRPHKELVPENDGSDLRGMLESKMTRAAMSVCGEGSSPKDYGLVQAMLPLAGGAKPGVFGDGQEAVWFGDDNGQPLQMAGPGPSDFLCDSEEFRKFWDALGEILQETDLYANKDIETLWFSRCSLVGPEAGLQEIARMESLVNDYLVAYTELVKFADDSAGHDYERGNDCIWARYPFSAMVVNNKEGNSLQGVLLAPLHPLRLAWLYSAERAAEKSCSNRRDGMTLLQVMEGWNFPWIGPAPSVPGNYPILTAVPTDDGESKLFAGWSYLVGPVSQYPSPIRPPARIAGYSGPGAASSGLTAGGMISAIRDYIRVHPYISTLSLDMASGSEGPRSVEMDRGLLNEISNLGLDQKLYDVDLRGGVRVYDSLNRQLPPPDAEEEMLGRLRGNEGKPIPFSWQRYNPRISPEVDLSFVEQATANFTSMEGKAGGAITYFPVRRFMPFQTPKMGGQVRMSLSGVIEPGAGWPEFTAALYAMEARDGMVQDLLVNTQAAEAGIESKATWEVTGNIQISPSLLSQQAAQKGDMLWEWRPGFLPRKMAQVEMSAFGIRPYSITAKIPEAFKKAVTKDLQDNKHPLEPKRLFSALGQRGVGLASLLAMGGHHVYGALGFYLGYELIDKLPVKDGVLRLVVPIDAVDLIFRAVCGEDLVDETRRADLLIIDIDEEGKDVNFVPVEIKCSLSEATNFPPPDGTSTEDGRAQLSASKSVIKKALNVLGDPGEHRNEISLEQAAIATVIECGLSLAPEISDNQGDVDPGKILSNVSGVDAKFKTNGELLFWFQRGPEAQLVWAKDEPNPGTGCLFVNTDDTPLVDHEPAMGWEEKIEEVGRWIGALGAKEDVAVSSPSEDAGEEASGSTPVDAQEPSPVEPSEVDADSDPGEEDEADAGDESEPAAGAEDDSPGTEDEPVDPGEEQADGAGAAEASPATGEEAAPSEEPGPKDERPGSSATAKELLRRAREKALEISEIGGKTDEAGALSDDDGCRRPKVDVGADPEGKRVLWDPLLIEQSLPNSHWVILGTSGTGKTQTIKAIVGELAEQGVIPVILDFNDDYYDEEYCLNIGATRVHVSSAGLPINPLEPAPDTTPEKAGQALVINQVYALADNLQKVFDLGDQQNNYLKNALKEVYKGAGVSTSWVSIEDTPFPQFNELKEHLETPSWGENTKRDERVINRLQALFDLEIFNSGQEGTFENLMETPSVIRLTDLPGDKTKEAVAELFLMSFYNFMLKKGHNTNLQYLVVVDEAHKIANLKAMDKLIRESRKYGVGVVVSSQQSGDFPDSVFANAGTLLSLGLQARADVRLVSQFIAGTGSQKVSEVASELRNLDPFNGILYNDHYKDPYVKVRITPYFQRAVSKSR